MCRPVKILYSHKTLINQSLGCQSLTKNRCNQMQRFRCQRLWFKYFKPMSRSDYMSEVWVWCFEGLLPISDFPILTYLVGLEVTNEVLNWPPGKIILIEIINRTVLWLQLFWLKWPKEISSVRNKNEKMILTILIFSIFVNGERLRRIRRQNPTCIRDDLPLQPFSTWSCSGTPEKCSMNCNSGFERSDRRKGNLDRFECRKNESGPYRLEIILRTILDGLLSQCRRSWVKLDGHCTKIGRFPGWSVLFERFEVEDRIISPLSNRTVFARPLFVR